MPNLVANLLRQSNFQPKKGEKSKRAMLVGVNIFQVFRLKREDPPPLPTISSSSGFFQSQFFNISPSRTFLFAWEHFVNSSCQVQLTVGTILVIELLHSRLELWARQLVHSRVLLPLSCTLALWQELAVGMLSLNCSTPQDKKTPDLIWCGPNGDRTFRRFGIANILSEEIGEQLPARALILLLSKRRELELPPSYSKSNSSGTPLPSCWPFRGSHLAHRDHDDNFDRCIL